MLPVLEAVAGELPVSIDTSKAEVARRALAAGAELVNDVTALRSDPELAGVVAEAGCYLCLMHMLGEPRTMQDDPRYDDVASEVAAFLEERLAFAVSAGVAEELVCLDPGIGFGKTMEQNFELVRRLDVLRALGRPVVIGFSRKRSLGRLVGDPTRPRARSPPASPPPSPPTSAARRSSASTTSARPSRRSPSPRRCRRDDDRAGRARALRLSRRQSRGARATGSCSSSTSGSRCRTERAPRTGSRTRSTTARWRRSSARSRTAAQFQLLEALAATLADELARPLPGRRRARPRPQAAGSARPAGRALGRDGRAPSLMPRAYVGLGSNLGDREHMIWGAIHMLDLQPRGRGRRRLVDPGDRSGRSRRPAAVPQRRRRPRHRARPTCAARPPARPSSASSAARATARASARGRSTSTCSSTATRSIDEPGLDRAASAAPRAAFRARAARRARPRSRRAGPRPGPGSARRSTIS